MNQDFIANSIAGVMPAARATGLFVSVATIQVPDGTLTANGFPSGTFVEVVGLTDLRCQIAPTSMMNVSASTMKGMGEQLAMNSSHVLFDDFYPDIETAWRQGGQAVIDGVLYANSDILGVESDSQSVMTRMDIRSVTQ